MAQEAKRFRYEVELDRHGRVAAEECPSLSLPREWTAEHLVLAALARCSISSFRYHARRAGIAVAAEASARGLVTKRADDGRYAFVAVECEVAAEIDPPPPAADLAELLGKAERDCFIAASLTSAPRYTWRVNGTSVRAAPS